MELYHTMKKPRLFLPSLEVILIALLLPLHGAHCESSTQGEGGGGGASAANLTVTGTVFCDACSSSSFSNHSYFLPGVKVRIDCMISVKSASKEEIKITAEKVTNNFGAYQLDIPAIDGFECATSTAAESFCRAAVLDNPSPLCNVPAVITTVGHISSSSGQDQPNACLYNLNSLYYRPGAKNGGQCGGGAGVPAPLNTSLFYCPPWPWPPIPFCTPRPWFPPIPFLTPPPPPLFPFPLPPIPFLTPPSPPPPVFPFPLPPWPWAPPPAAQPPPSSFPFPHLPPIFSPPSPPPPPPPPAFPFPQLPPLPHFPPLPSLYPSPPPPPPPPPPPSFPWPFPPLPPFFPPYPSPTTPSPPPLVYSRKDPSTWSSSSKQQP